MADIDKRDSYGKTPLHCAVSAGQIATVKYLLHCHGNPNLKDHREEAPLHVAVRTGNVDIVEVRQLLGMTSVITRKYYSRFNKNLGMTSVIARKLLEV